MHPGKHFVLLLSGLGSIVPPMEQVAAGVEDRLSYLQVS
jgi:hypothetical protein